MQNACSRRRSTTPDTVAAPRTHSNAGIPSIDWMFPSRLRIPSISLSFVAAGGLALRRLRFSELVKGQICVVLQRACSDKSQINQAPVSRQFNSWPQMVLLLLLMVAELRRWRLGRPSGAPCCGQRPGVSPCRDGPYAPHAVLKLNSACLALLQDFCCKISTW